jgi:predicted esterase
MIAGGRVVVTVMVFAALGACSGGTSSSVAPTTAPISDSTPTATVVPTDTASTATASPVVVEDVSLGAGTRPAYLVRPDDAAARSAAGIVWFHWLESGSPTSNRTEFLEEAKEMASRGVTSILVDGSFPWHEDPESISHDTAALDADLAMLATAYEALLARPEVDPARTALVGHDFGSMYESVLFARDDRPKALVMMAPTARWADWFAKYWVISDDEDEYKAALQPYDPVEVLPNAGGRPVLLQFADNDKFIPLENAQQTSATAGAGGDSRHYDTDHGLNEEARIDRDAWLVEKLGL